MAPDGGESIRLGTDSSTSSIVSPIRRSPFLATPSGFDDTPILPSSPLEYPLAHQVPAGPAPTTHGFDLLEDSSDELVEPSQHSLTSSSGVTMYADATDDTTRVNRVNPSLHHLRDHMNSRRASSMNFNPGLIPVRPIRIPYGNSKVRNDSFDFGLGVNAMAPLQSTSSRSAEVTNISRPSSGRLSSLLALDLSSNVVPPDQEEGISSTYSPRTPRSRRAALSELSSSQLNIRRSRLDPDELGSPSDATPSRKLLKQKRTRNLHTTEPDRPLQLTLGRPRDSSNNSSANQQSQRSISSDGRLEPDRQVSATRMSYLRRAGATNRTNNAFLMGLPHLPHMPVRQMPLTFDERPGLVVPLLSGDVARDIWGRPLAGRAKSWLILLVSALFPPLWLFLGVGYLDQVAGTIERSVKIAALFLASLTMVVCIALVVAFAILRW